MDLLSLSDEKLTSLYNEALVFIKTKFNVTQKDIGIEIGMDPAKISRGKNKNEEAKREDQIIVLQQLKSYYKIHYSEEGVKVLYPKEDENLVTLASRLAINLVDVSTEFNENHVPHDVILSKEEVRELCRNSQTRERFIMITGAGASFAATNKMIPRAEEGIKKIREEIIATKKIPDELLEEELDRLQQVYRLDPTNFETQLLAFSKFSRKAVIAALKKLCNHSHVSSLSYEIIAHMLKHRLLDIIINFNYDEILDEVIREEIHDGDYEFIYSDGHCPEQYEDLLINNRLKQPIYVKPHGTISHQSSMRFTQEDYFSIPQKLRSTIGDLFAGKVANSSDLQQDRLELNLIIIGYNLVSFEFIPLITDYLEKSKGATVKLWIFDTVNRTSELIQELPNKWADCFKCYFFDLKGKNNQLETYLQSLWELIEENFRSKFKPKGIERHLMIDHIFSLQRNDYKNRNLNLYFRDRFYVELMISLLQSGGILNAKQILEDRAGKYFSLYQAKASGLGEQSLRFHCNQIGLKVYKGFVTDAFTLKDPNIFYNESEELYETIFKRLCRELHKTHSINLQSREKEFLELCSQIRDRNIAKITPHYTNPHNYLFSKIKQEDILNTPLAWTYRFQKAVVEDTWDLMLAITEKGRFLKRDLLENPRMLDGKTVELVLASNDLEDYPDLSQTDLEFFEQKINLLSGSLNFLPWWLHNKHLVLLLEKRSAEKKQKKGIQNWKLKKGFYYESRMLSRRINPVRITAEADLEILLRIFANYWYRGKAYTNSPPGPKQVPIIADETQMNDIISELLSLHGNNINK